MQVMMIGFPYSLFAPKPFREPVSVKSPALRNTVAAAENLGKNFDRRG